MIIFIRGLPGSGKTTISNKLAEKLQWPVVHVDMFKKEYMEKHLEANFLKEVIPASYTQTFTTLEEFKSKNVIVEEVFRNSEFVQKIIAFCIQNKIATAWFKIIRDREVLFAVNDEKTRKIINTPEILNRMEQQMNNIKIQDEVEIYNKSIVETTEKIISWVS